MCQDCNEEVAHAGEFLDNLLRAEREVRNTMQDLTSAEATIRLACVVLDSFKTATKLAGGDMNAPLQDLALGLALCCTRLLAAQDIYGMPAT